MDTKSKDLIKEMVKEKYASLSGSSGSCCDMNACTSVSGLGEMLNYSEKDLSYVADAKMPVLGCGNPVAEADLKPGETVVDLGCGAGFDAFLSAKKVTEKGRVIGIDMTPEMIEKAIKNSENLKIENLEGAFLKNPYLSGYVFYCRSAQHDSVLFQQQGFVCGRPFQYYADRAPPLQ